MDSHPHCFIVTSVRFIFSDQGLAKIRIDWDFDDFLAGQIISESDVDKNGRLNSAEKKFIKNNFFDSLAEESWFTHIKVNGKPVPIKNIEDFSLFSADGRLAFTFTVPCPVSFSHESNEVRVSVYDPTFFCALSFPEQMPVLVKNEGDLDHAVRVVENLEESYYFGQIHPWEAILLFSSPPGWKKQPGQMTANAAPGQNAYDEKPGNKTSSLATSSFGQADRAKRMVNKIAGEPQKFSLRDWVFKKQRDIYASMADLAGNLKGPEGSESLMWLLGLSFLYGVIHAAGPGHGKAVAASFVLAGKARPGRALLLGNMIAIFHGLSGAILVIALRKALLSFTGGTLGEVEYITKIVSYSLISLLGLFLLVKSILEWKKRETDFQDEKGKGDVLVMAVMVGLVPCPGVVLVLLFCLSLDIMGVGLLMALALTLGMAVTISLITLLVSASKQTASGLLARYEKAAVIFEKGMELAASLAVLSLGVVFLTFNLFL